MLLLRNEAYIFSLTRSALVSVSSILLLIAFCRAILIRRIIFPRPGLGGPPSSTSEKSSLYWEQSAKFRVLVRLINLMVLATYSLSKMKEFVSVASVSCEVISGSSDSSCSWTSEVTYVLKCFQLFKTIFKLLFSPPSVIKARLTEGEFSRPLFVDPAAVGVVAAFVEGSSLFFAWKAMTTAAESAMPAVT